MSRICYFKQHGSTGLALASDLADVVSSVDAKADASVVTALSGTVDAKADAVDVYSKTAADALLADKLVAADIADKADSSYLQQVLDGVNEALGNRAQVNAVYSITAMDALLVDKADASALASKLEASDIDGKLDTSVHDARVTAENQFYNAMIESLYLESSVGSGTEFDYTGLVGF